MFSLSLSLSLSLFLSLTSMRSLNCIHIFLMFFYIEFAALYFILLFQFFNLVFIAISFVYSSCFTIICTRFLRKYPRRSLFGPCPFLPLLFFTFSSLFPFSIPSTLPFFLKNRLCRALTPFFRQFFRRRGARPGLDALSLSFFSLLLLLLSLLLSVGI